MAIRARCCACSGDSWLSAIRNKMKWIKATYASSAPVYISPHDCAQLSTSLASDWYGQSKPLGGTYHDESRSTAHPCWTAIGTPYTSSMVLN